MTIANFSVAELELLELGITSYKREIKDDIMMYRKFEHKSKDVVKEIADLQNQYFDLETLWEKVYEVEKKVRAEGKQED
jgi:hypothetical protein